MVEALAEHDRATAEHAGRVSGLAQRLATRMGVGQDKLALVAQAGLLHDIGKLDVPAEILHKRGALSIREWPLVRRQVSCGVRILLAAGLSEVAIVVRASHERWDGLGYPDGLSGHGAPFFSRMILIADAYDSMTKGRTWAEPITPHEAAAELRLHSGTQFDPGLVEPMIELVSAAPSARRFRRPGRFSIDRVRGRSSAHHGGEPLAAGR